MAEPWDEENSIDDLFNKEVNHEEAQAVRAQNEAPKGLYVTDPSEHTPTVSTVTFKDKDVKGEETGQLRRVVSFNFRASATIDGKTWTPYFRNVRLSPDLRQQQVWSGENGERRWTGETLNKVDVATRLYAEAVKAYTVTLGSPPETEADVFKFLTMFPVRLSTYISKYTGELTVGGIRAHTKVKK